MASDGMLMVSPGTKTADRTQPRQAKAPAGVAMFMSTPALGGRRAILMAESLAGAGYAVTLYAATGHAAPQGLSPAVRFAGILPPAVEQSGTGPAPDLSETAIVHVAGAGILKWITPYLPPGVRLIYDVSGTPELPATGQSRWQALWSRWRLFVGERGTARRIDAVVCPGYVFGEFLQREFKLHRVPVVPIYAALPQVAEITPRRPPGFSDRPVAVVLDTDYGALREIIQGMGQLRQVELLILNGRGDWAPCAPWVEQARMGKRLHRMEVAEADLLPILAACQVGLVLPQDREQTSLYEVPPAFFRFIMAGLPVVASAFPELERIVGKHSIGMLADPASSTEIADCTLRVATDRVFRERLLHNVGVVRERRYNWEVQSERLLDLYDYLLERPAGAAGQGATPTFPDASH